MATARGLLGLAVNRLWRLRGRGDHVVARYALAHEYVLVTNNLVEFERIYQGEEFHPGIILFDCPSKLRKKAWQAKMMEMALDEIETEDPVQQAIVISAQWVEPREVELVSDRYYLPDLAIENRDPS